LGVELIAPVGLGGRRPRRRGLAQHADDLPLPTAAGGMQL